MKTIVCIKQVPQVEQLKFDPQNKRLIRDGVELEINPFDRRAISKALELRQNFGGQVIALTMGPPQASSALLEALAMGCDQAVHLLGREFAGADTLATARALALACRKLGFDLVFCGKYSTDAETAQVPPMLAEMLDVPHISAVTSLEFSPTSADFTAVRELDDGFETVQATLPAVLSASERLIKPFKVTPADLELARQKPLLTWGAADLGGELNLFGQSGSPTFVSEIYNIEPKRQRRIRVVQGDVEEVVRETLHDLRQIGGMEARQVVPDRRIHPSQGDGAPDRAVWVLAELVAGQVRPVTYELLGKGLELTAVNGGQLAAILLGNGVARYVPEMAAYGAEKVYLADSPSLEAYSSELYTIVLADVIRRHDPFAVLIPSTSYGRDLAPRLAARLNIGLTGDCIGLEIDPEGSLVQLKPAFGGNIVAPILSRTRPAMATIRPGMFTPAEPDYRRKATIASLAVDHLPVPRVRTLKVELSAGEGVLLDNARVVLGVGMGVGGPENLPLVRQLAEALGAALAASRKVVDAGWLPRQLQVGLTGRSLAPQLYIALGISGKFNHLVGIQRAGLILAINNDPHAEIFQHCDYGIVGDWAEVVPAMLKALK